MSVLEKTESTCYVYGCLPTSNKSIPNLNSVLEDCEQNIDHCF